MRGGKQPGWLPGFPVGGIAQRVNKVSGQLLITSASNPSSPFTGLFVVPEGVYKIWATVQGAGGSGGRGNGSTVGGSGGDAGQVFVDFEISVYPGQVIPYVLGQGVSGSNTNNTPGTTGGTTTFGTFVTAPGGAGGAISAAVGGVVSMGGCASGGHATAGGAAGGYGGGSYFGPGGVPNGGAAPVTSYGAGSAGAPASQVANSAHGAILVRW